MLEIQDRSCLILSISRWVFQMLDSSLSISCSRRMKHSFQILWAVRWCLLSKCKEKKGKRITCVKYLDISRSIWRWNEQDVSPRESQGQGAAKQLFIPFESFKIVSAHKWVKRESEMFCSNDFLSVFVAVLKIFIGVARESGKREREGNWRMIWGGFYHLFHSFRSLA